MNLLSLPLAYSNAVVASHVPAGLPGVYVLYDVDNRELHPAYAGRSDTNLRRRLREHPYRHLPVFAFATCLSARIAYLVERQLYLRLRPPMNRAFPAQPNGYGEAVSSAMQHVLRIRSHS